MIRIGFDSKGFVWDSIWLDSTRCGQGFDFDLVAIISKRFHLDSGSFANNRIQFDSIRLGFGLGPVQIWIWILINHDGFGLDSIWFDSVHASLEIRLGLRSKLRSHTNCVFMAKT